jgi:hypothetical protein
MKKIILLTALIFVKTIVHGQHVWEQKYDDKVAQTFARTLANKYVLAGTKNESMQKRWHIFQTDSIGKIEWDTTFLHGYDGYSRCIEPTPDSGFIVAGYEEGNSYFLKYDKNNNLNWESKILPHKGGVDGISSIITSTENGYIATGTVTLGFSELFLIKLDENGDSIWTKIYFSGGAHGVSLAKSPDGAGYYCLASTSYARTLLLRIDEQGDTIWSRKIHENSQATSMVLTSDTNLVISSVEMSRNLVFTKVDLTGNIIWEKRYNSDYTYNRCNHISETSDKGFITSNYMENHLDYNNLWIMKLDEHGDSLFSITSTTKLRPEKIMETNDGFYVFLANDGKRPRLIKTDKSGSVITSIHSTKPQNQINLYPNPVQDKLTVILDKPLHKNGFYKIFNSSGILIKEGKLYQTTTIDLSNIAKGLYILYMDLEDQIITRKILK